jgi:3-oxosteroid 1-dehydrogenase
MLSPIQKAPYVAMPFNRCILTTKGGLRTNEHAQVLREDGSVITGLYCAGAAMANPIGTRAISAGTTIGPNMTWGYICAQNVLRTNRPTAS